MVANGVSARDSPGMTRSWPYRWLLLFVVATVVVASAQARGSVGAARWVMMDLGVEVQSGSLINDRGQVIFTGLSPREHGFLWSRGKLTDLGTLGGRSSDAVAINDRGQIIGWSLHP